MANDKYTLDTNDNTSAPVNVGSGITCTLKSEGQKVEIGKLLGSDYAGIGLSDKRFYAIKTGEVILNKAVVQNNSAEQIAEQGSKQPINIELISTAMKDLGIQCHDALGHPSVPLLIPADIARLAAAARGQSK